MLKSGDRRLETGVQTNVFSGDRRRETGVQTNVFSGDGRQETGVQANAFSGDGWRETGGQALLNVSNGGERLARRFFFRMLAFCCARQPVGSRGAGLGSVGSGRGGLGVAGFAAGQAREGLHVDANVACRQPFLGVSFAVWVNCTIFAGNILYLYGLLLINKVDTSGAKVDTSGVKVDTSGAKVDTSELDSKARFGREELEKLILSKAQDYATIEEIATGVGRSVDYIKNKVMPRMVKEGKMVRLHQKINHPNQKYKAK